MCAGRSVALAWFSPDCRHHSRAKGGKPKDKRIRGLAWVTVKWAKLVRPRVIILENVREFEDWGPLLANDQPDPTRKGLTFRRFVGNLSGLGYQVEWRVLDAARFGAPTHRKRLFLIARCDGRPIEWPSPTHGPRLSRSLFEKELQPYRTAAECIDWHQPCPSIFERKRPLAEKTLARIAAGIRRYVIESQEPFIVTCNHDGGFRGQSTREPMKTITAARDAHGLVVPSVVEIDNKSNGNNRALSIGRPLTTIVKENRHALVTAFLAKHFGGVVGQRVDRPAGTVTAKDHHSLVAAHLTKFYGTNVGADLRKPLPTVTGGGQHLAEVRAFLVKYYGTAKGQSLRDPMHTVTSKDRLGLVTVEGVDYAITDIGMRMLNPRELARAQGFPDSYVLTGTKSNQVAKIGNSVCPPVVEALVRANLGVSDD